LAVVCDSLIQGLLREGDCLRFAFDQHKRTHGLIIDDGIAAFMGSPYGDRFFDGDKGTRIAKLLHQMVKQLLTNPLFGR